MEYQNRKSHPVWVRGLKQTVLYSQTVEKKSHPVWVRGLKRHGNQQREDTISVAPRVGAWIETVPIDYDKLLSGVAPRVGAWIETTKSNRLKMPSVASHPVWVRGLKLHIP